MKKKGVAYLGGKKITFKVYSFFYPIVWFISRLDKLIFFQRGYGLMVWAKKID